MGIVQEIDKSTSDYWQNPLALPGEKLYLAERKHWLVLVPVLLLLGIFFLFSTSVLLYLFLFVFHFILLAIVAELVLFSFFLTIVVKVLTEWYFEVYAVTSRRLLEIRYTPLASYILNDVLLDQVRCTEVDISTKGIINKYLDIGDITITFDRPIHQQEFVLASIKDFHKISTFLCPLLIVASNPAQKLQPKQIWSKNKTRSRIFQIIDDDQSKNLSLYP